MIAWRFSTWGEEVSLEYGKALREYSSGKYKVYGANGPIGWCDKFLSSGPGVILGRKGAYRGVQFSKNPFYVIDTAYYIVPRNKMDMRWLYYSVIYHKLGEIDDGSPIPSTTRSAVYVNDIDIPPLLEQQAIAHILGTLDDKIELNRRQNATLEAMAQAIFKDWFVDFGPVRAKKEGRQPEGMSREIADLFPDRLDDEGKPEGWGWKPLSCFFELLGGGTPKTSVDEYWNGEIPWFSVVDTPSGSDLFVVNTQKNITKYGFENSSVKIVPQNCTIITARGTVGKLALTGVPMTINQSCYAAKSSKYIGNFFIYFLLRKSISHLESNAHGSVFSTITRSTFETIYSDYPTESLCIAFEESVFPLMEKIKKNVLEVNTLTSLRDTLLPKLISGELRVPDAEKMVADIV